jgi:hypothetical protein
VRGIRVIEARIDGGDNQTYWKFNEETGEIFDDVGLRIGRGRIFNGRVIPIELCSFDGHYKLIRQKIIHQN